MANKSLTDLTARTSTEDTDLIHVNASGTDYKQTKSDFMNGTLLKTFANSSLLTAQVDALPAQGTWFGRLVGYGYQSTTGIPVDSNGDVFVQKYNANFAILDFHALGENNTGYRKCKVNGTWQSSWTKMPTRAEIDSLNSSLTNSFLYYDITSTMLKNNWQVNASAWYGKIGRLGFVQGALRNGTMNTQAFTLPSGYRPLTNMLVPLIGSAGTNGVAIILTTGEVNFSNQTDNGNSIFCAIFPIS